MFCSNIYGDTTFAICFFALLFCNIVMKHVWCVANDFTCSNIQNMVLADMQHCVLENNIEGVKFPGITCDFLDIARDNGQSIQFPFYLYFRFKFSFIQNLYHAQFLSDDENLHSTSVDGERREELNDTVPICVGLSSVNASKVNGRTPWKNATIGILPRVAVFILLGIDGLLDITFNATIPVGIADVQKKCLLQNRNDSECITRFRMLDQVRNPTAKLSPLDGEGEEFWVRTRNTYMELLGGEIHRLHLYFNQKYSIANNFIAQALVDSELRELQLKGAKWPEGPVLPALPKLKHLDLTNDGITALKTDTYQHFPNLERLILADNSLKEFPRDLANLTKLELLDLSNNPISGLTESDDWIMELKKNLKDLKWLNLSHVPLRNVSVLLPLLGSSQDNSSYVRLLSLNLSHSEIGVIDNEKIFQYQTSLQELDLSGNKLTNIPQSMFLYNENLKILDLSYNLFTVGPMIELRPHRSLNILNLANNRIEYPGNIIKFGFVNYLDLSGNNISEWKDDSVFFTTTSRGRHLETSTENYGNRSWVKRLNISNNHISTVSSRMGKSLNALDLVDLGGNPLNCENCLMSEFQQWLNSTNVTILNNGRENALTCSRPTSKAGTPIVEIEFGYGNCTETIRVQQGGFNNYLVLGVSIAVILILIFICGILFYKYRYEFTYILHLINSRRRERKTDSKVEEYEYDAFICYSGKDRPWVIGKLLPKLENGPEKFRLCLHERDFILGSYITQNIVRAMHCSRHTLMILSNNFVKSQWCRWELEVANHKLFKTNEDFLILVEYEHLDRSTLPQHLKFLMDTRTYLEWPQEESEEDGAWKRLTEVLGTSINSEIAQNV